MTLRPASRLDFNDRFAVNLLNLIHDLLRPGGRCILGIFHPANPTRGLMDAERMPETLVLNALLNAWSRAPAAPGLVFHSDRGSQYAGTAFRRTLQALRIEPSMSRKGNCWDNAVAESFFATLKNEEATQVYPTKAQAHESIAQYIHGFYNPERRHSALGYLSPDNYARTLKAA